MGASVGSGVSPTAGGMALQAGAAGASATIISRVNPARVMALEF
jgi:hypothetical protein